MLAAGWQRAYRDLFAGAILNASRFRSHSPIPEEGPVPPVTPLPGAPPRHALPRQPFEGVSSAGGILLSRPDDHVAAERKDWVSATCLALSAIRRSKIRRPPTLQMMAASRTAVLSRPPARPPPGSVLSAAPENRGEDDAKRPVKRARPEVPPTSAARASCRGCERADKKALRRDGASGWFYCADCRHPCRTPGCPHLAKTSFPYCWYCFQLAI